MTNNFQEGLADTEARTRSEHRLDNIREQGGFFVEAVRLTRMPMIVTDATLPGNPIIFASPAFIALSGYELEEITGQDPHFMNGPATDMGTVRRYEAAMEQGATRMSRSSSTARTESRSRAMLFASPLDDGQGRVLHHFMSYLDINRQYQARKIASEAGPRAGPRSKPGQPN